MQLKEKGGDDKMMLYIFSVALKFSQKKKDTRLGTRDDTLRRPVVHVVRKHNGDVVTDSVISVIIYNRSRIFRGRLLNGGRRAQSAGTRARARACTRVALTR